MNIDFGEIFTRSFVQILRMSSANVVST